MVGRCATETPEWPNVGQDHFVACHHAEDLDFSR